MMSSPVVLILFILFLFNISQSCDITKECPITNNVTWATNGTICHVFRNTCLLDNVNCHHQNNNVSKLEVITKEKCQLLCISKCPEEDEPVCGYYSDDDDAKRHTFKNQCEIDAYVCKTGEPFFVYGVGPCETPDAKDEEVGGT
ncbi:uncharacterized protein LOC129941316 [Eupeodes corollae]|uniref:uncharacterized protein LOC129941316 n=1 Tax=Eupeodes corollae TaxID=290404 RepID=UPI0024934A2E|nr:uncharacterized protein LOC129941316 [Eupeodes corollae]